MIVGPLWVVCSIGGGALLALLAQKMNPSLSWRRLWPFYSFLLAAFTAVVFGVAVL